MVETIRNVIHSHRPYWKCFQKCDALPHDPIIRFEYDEEPLQIFPTRGAYAFVTEDMTSYYNDWLDDLIESTPTFTKMLIIFKL